MKFSFAFLRICLSTALLFGTTDAGNNTNVVTKTRPSLTPEPKTVLFVAHFLVNTEVNQMLQVADKLQARGHQVEFIVNDLYRPKVEKAGFAVVDTTPNPFADPQAKAASQAAFGKALTATTWNSYVADFFPEVMAGSAASFEPCLVTVQNYFNKTKTPDVMVSSMFSDCAVDVAKKYDIPTGIMFASPLGHLFGYEDHVAAPDSFLWSSVAQHSALWPRLRKILSLALLIGGTMDIATAQNNVRVKHGIAPVGPPLTNWDKVAVFHTWSLGVDLARPLRPLTFSTGFVLSEYHAPKPDELSSLDQQALQILEQNTGGVILAAFGTLAAPSTEMVKEIVQGLDAWILTQQPQPAAAIFILNDFSQVLLEDVLPADSKVHIMQGWVNQRMILEHDNTQVFVTHGGQGSIAEAIYHQVPMLAIPIFGDQPNNAHRIQEAGIGRKLHFREEDVTAAAVTECLLDITSSEAYKTNLQRQYQISARAGGADKIANVVEDMMLWGHLDHLVPVTERVPFPANTNADLYLVLAAVLAAVLYVTYKCIALTVACILGRRTTSVNSSSKKKLA